MEIHNYGGLSPLALHTDELLTTHLGRVTHIHLGKLDRPPLVQKMACRMFSAKPLPIAEYLFLIGHLGINLDEI